jgi:hypothetical protein
MDGHSILTEIREIVKSLPLVRARDRTKLTGALAIEVIRNRLLQSGLSVSQRDVFINGDPTEFDTLVVRPACRAVCGIVYDPIDVAAVLEIKFSGVYSRRVPTDLRELFGRLKSKHPHIQCIYLTVCENPKFAYRIKGEDLGFPAFTLNWWKNYRKIDVEPGDTLQSAIECLRKAVQGLPHPSV